MTQYKNKKPLWESTSTGEPDLITGAKATSDSNVSAGGSGVNMGADSKIEDFGGKFGGSNASAIMYPEGALAALIRSYAKRQASSAANGVAVSLAFSRYDKIVVHESNGRQPIAKGGSYMPQGKESETSGYGFTIDEHGKIAMGPEWIEAMQGAKTIEEVEDLVAQIPDLTGKGDQ